jgi:hypothetical protein
VRLRRRTWATTVTSRARRARQARSSVGSAGSVGGAGDVSARWATKHAVVEDTGEPPRVDTAEAERACDEVRVVRVVWNRPNGDQHEWSTRSLRPSRV